MASWIITKDVICDGQYDGEHSGNVEYIEAGKCRNQFKMYDDDDELYFEGLSGNGSSFDPIDDFGVGFGCTYIKYKNIDTGKWEVL